MVQKIKFHFAGLDEPIEQIVDSIDDIPTKPIGIGQIASIELDVLLASQQDVVDLIFVLSELISNLPSSND